MNHLAQGAQCGVAFGRKGAVQALAGQPGLFGCLSHASPCFDHMAQRGQKTGLAAFFIVRSIRRRRRAAKSEVITETAEQPKPTVTDETPATAPSGATAVEESGRE